MHRMLLNFPEQVDHINGNTLDNRKSNLRIASLKQNTRNLTTKRKSKSGFRGVFRAPKNYVSRPWKAGIKHNNKNIHLGYFSTPEEAAKAFDKAAKELFGEFHGKLNFE